MGASAVVATRNRVPRIGVALRRASGPWCGEGVVRVLSLTSAEKR